MARKAIRTNITIQPDILEEFKKYGERNGVLISPFVAVKMKEFIEEEKSIEKLKSEKKL